MLSSYLILIHASAIIIIGITYWGTCYVLDIALNALLELSHLKHRSFWLIHYKDSGGECNGGAKEKKGLLRI